MLDAGDRNIQSDWKRWSGAGHQGPGVHLSAADEISRVRYTPPPCAIIRALSRKPTMSFFRRLVSTVARMRLSSRDSRLGEAGEPEELDAADPEPPELDAAEEFQKIQRGLRRLSLASDRSGEVLQAVAARVDELQQTLVKMSRPGQTALTLEEAELLRILDQLDRAADAPDVPAATRASIDSVSTALLAGARWQPVAQPGARPDGVDIRIAEFLGQARTNGHANAQIHRVLEQGYRRADGTLLRPGVVIAAAAVGDAPPVSEPAGT